MKGKEATLQVSFHITGRSFVMVPFFSDNVVCMTIFDSGKFGASSPERERKLLSLAEDKV